MNKITIKKADNGFIIDYVSGDGLVSYVVADSEVSSARTTVELCNTITALLGLQGSRHDEERFYAVAAPGDKHEFFTVAHDDVLF